MSTIIEILKDGVDGKTAEEHDGTGKLVFDNGNLKDKNVYDLTEIRIE